MKEISKLNAFIENRYVGTLAITKNGLTAFEYSDEWIAEGYSLNPFSLPLKRKFSCQTICLLMAFLVFLPTRFPMAGADY